MADKLILSESNLSAFVERHVGTYACIEDILWTAEAMHHRGWTTNDRLLKLSHVQIPPYVVSLIPLMLRMLVQPALNQIWNHF